MRAGGEECVVGSEGGKAYDFVQAVVLVLHLCKNSVLPALAFKIHPSDYLLVGRLDLMVSTRRGCLLRPFGASFSRLTTMGAMAMATIAR